jgi:hypothetical protein
VKFAVTSTAQVIDMVSRRRVLALTSALPLSKIGSGQTPKPVTAAIAPLTETVSLNGQWAFCLDPQNNGLSGKWYEPDAAAVAWRQVTVLTPGRLNRRTWSTRVRPGTAGRSTFPPVGPVT